MTRKGFRKPVVSMRGVVVDMDALRAANEESLAVGAGGTKMNARGDIIGHGGKIEISREQIVREYYAKNPNGPKQVSLKPAIPDQFETPQEALARMVSQQPAPVDTPPTVVSPRKGRKLIDTPDDEE